MEFLLPLVIVAFLIEAVVETVKPLWDPEKRTELPDRLAGLAVGELTAIVGGFDVFAANSVPLANLEALGAWPGIVLTGILLSRGANFMHSLVNLAQGIPDLIKARINGSG